MSQPWMKRKRLFVNRFVQGHVIANVAWYWCIYHIALWHAMFMYYYFQYRKDVLAGGAARPFSELYVDFASAHIAVIVCAAVVLPIIIWDALRLTHRIVGPLVRFTAVLKSLSRGEPVAKFKLRKGDLLVGLQDALNEFLASPYAPRREEPKAAAADQQANPDISGLLGDIRAIQESLCRVYDPEAPETPIKWEAELKRPIGLDPCDQAQIDREIELARNELSPAIAPAPTANSGV